MKNVNSRRRRLFRTLNWSAMKKYFAEFIGTFALVFAGTGAIVINNLTAQLSHIGISLVFGLIVLTMIYALGDVSGAHLNPAVTVGFWASRRLDSGLVLPYVASQLLGALVASGILHFLFPTDLKLGITQPSGPVIQAFLLETIMTWLLMFVILSVSTGAKEKGVIAGVAVGSVVGLEALLGGPISGASMNPARSLGPALITGNLAFVWIYIIAPLLGALLAVPVCRCVRENGCCTIRESEISA
jgi:aquaporin Z